MILGIDIGGANTKVASSDGAIVELHYIPLWKDTTLANCLADIYDRFVPEGVKVVTTGELADCFTSKREGVQKIMDIVGSSFKCPVEYLGSDCQLSERPDDILTLAAANWTASAMFVAQNHSDCVFVDVGSTTSDIIPIVGGKPVANTSDYMRLQNNELVYAGTLRTNLAALAHTVQICSRYEDGKYEGCADARGNIDDGMCDDMRNSAEGQVTPQMCTTSSELFATTGDVYLLLGDIPKEQYTCETADGAGKSLEDVKRRIARFVCADLEEINDVQLMGIAEHIRDVQIAELTNAIESVCKRAEVDVVVGTGLGEFLIAEAAKRADVKFISISSEYGKTISTIFPAYAVANIS